MTPLRDWSARPKALVGFILLPPLMVVVLVSQILHLLGLTAAWWCAIGATLVCQLWTGEHQDQTTLYHPEVIRSWS